MNTDFKKKSMLYKIKTSRLLFIFLLYLFFVVPLFSWHGADFSYATDTFEIPLTPPDVVITSEKMKTTEQQVFFENNVRFERENDVLSCHYAIVNDTPRWLEAQREPELLRKEFLPDKQLIRELFLKADNMLFNQDLDIFSASQSVYLFAKEYPENETWDQSQHEWVEVFSDELIVYRDKKKAIFTGQVKVKDRTRLATGDKLDYDEATSMFELSVRSADEQAVSATDSSPRQVYIEIEELNEKTGEIEKKILTGNKVTYDVNTGEAISE